MAEVFIRSWLRHPTTVSSMWTLPQVVKIQNGTIRATQYAKSPSGSIIIGSMPLLIMKSFGLVVRVTLGSWTTIGCQLDETRVFSGDHRQITCLFLCKTCETTHCNLLEIKLPTYLPITLELGLFFIKFEGWVPENMNSHRTGIDTSLS